MNGRQLLWLVLIGGVAVWLWKSGRVTKDPAPPAPVPKAWEGAAPGLAGEACLTAAEDANRQIGAAAAVLVRGPVDPSAFTAASERARSAIAEAESRCGGGGSAAEQKAMGEARGALSDMRALLSDVSGALSGGGSASEVPQQSARIEARLAAARAALRG